MRFPRQTKIFRGQLDAAPFAGVFFLLVIFLLLHSSLVFTPGVPIQLPQTGDLPGVDAPTFTVAVDNTGQVYYENQVANEDQLLKSLRARVSEMDEAVTLVIQADRNVRYEVLLRLALLAEQAGIKTALLATRPATIPRPQPHLSP